MAGWSAADIDRIRACAKYLLWQELDNSKQLCETCHSERAYCPDYEPEVYRTATWAIREEAQRWVETKAITANGFDFSLLNPKEYGQKPKKTRGGKKNKKKNTGYVQPTEEERQARKDAYYSSDTYKAKLMQVEEDKKKNEKRCKEAGFSAEAVGHWYTFISAAHFEELETKQEDYEKAQNMGEVEMQETRTRREAGKLRMITDANSALAPAEVPITTWQQLKELQARMKAERQQKIANDERNLAEKEERMRTDRQAWLESADGRAWLRTINGGQ